MQFAAAEAGSVSLGTLLIDPGASDDQAVSPIVTELNGVDLRGSVRMNTLRITDTLGQPVTASFQTVNTQNVVPKVGDRVRVRYYSLVLFAGTIDHVDWASDDLTTIIYSCQCLDWSQILHRRKLRRNFTDLPIQNILDSILDNELLGEGLTIGTIDTRVTMPLVDARDAKIFEVFRTMAAAAGQTFYVDFDQAIQMRSTTLPVAPLILNDANVLIAGTQAQQDRETYRNRQTVVVTGTPPEGEEAGTGFVTRENADQIAARAAVEGGTGIYEEIEQITHPTSNDGADLAILGIGYANLRLATSGTPRLTVQLHARSYGFRAGQIAEVDLPGVGVVGTFVIQRVTIREVGAVELFHDLELTNSSLQQRAYEAWLGIVKTGQVTVQVPSSLTNNLQTFGTPGSFTWTVPAGVTTAEFTCFGGSGAPGGGWRYHNITSPVPGCNWLAPGGDGGASGKAISVVSVLPGQVFDILVGAAGATIGTIGYALASCGGSPGPATAGDDGTMSQVSLGSVIVCQGNAGLGGGAAQQGYPSIVAITGAHGSTGSGIGDAVSVGGGRIGGRAERLEVVAEPGQDGRAEVRW